MFRTSFAAAAVAAISCLLVVATGVRVASAVYAPEPYGR
jgi:hypothetical protein